MKTSKRDEKRNITIKIMKNSCHNRQVVMATIKQHKSRQVPLLIHDHIANGAAVI